MPIHRWMASAAGGTSQRLKAGPATVRSFVKKPGNVATDDMGLPLGDALSNVSAVAPESTAKRLGSEDLGPQIENGPRLAPGPLCHLAVVGGVEPGAKNRKLGFKPPEQLHCCNALPSD